MKNNYKKVVVAIIACISMLSGCVQSPAKSVIASKKEQSWTNESPSLSENKGSLENSQPQNEFVSTDQSVHFFFNADENVTFENMSVIEVAPHLASTADAIRIANVLFGGTQGYEGKPLLEQSYSKSEINDCIARWSPYTSSEGIKSLYGVDDDFVVDIVKQKIEYLTEIYDNAPALDASEPCKWEFKKEAYYNYSGEEAVEAESELDNDMIMATFELNGARYDYNVAIRDKSDYKLSDISAYFHTAGSPMSIDAAIYQANFCRTPKPSDEEVSTVRNKAEEMLSEMELGEWYVSDCTVENRIPEIGEYVINVTAYPVLNGVNTLPVQQLTNLKSQANYASNYYMSITNFEFSANGDLISFHMSSPIDTTQVIDGNTSVLDARELIVRAQEHLTLSDAASYLPFEIDAKAAKNIACVVSIDDIQYGLSRVKVPNTDNIYYYVPSMMMMGNVVVQSKDGQKTFYATESAQPLVRINAIDGTIIEKN